MTIVCLADNVIVNEFDLGRKDNGWGYYWLEKLDNLHTAMHGGQIGPNRTERGFVCPQNWHKLTQKKAQKAKNYSSKSMSHNMAQNNA